MIVTLLYNCKGERTECRNYRGISLFLSVGGKIYAGILVVRVCSVTWSFTDDEQGSCRAGREYR